MSRKTTPTYVLLNQITLGATASSVVFSAIPQNYGDLVLVCRVQGTSSAGGLTFELQFNLDTGNSYHDIAMGASNGGAFSNSQSSVDGLRLNYMGSNGNEVSVFVAHIMDYSATDKHKTVLTRHSGTADGQRTDAFAGRWANTAAVTTVTVRPDANSIASGTTFSLYGVVA